MSDAGSPFLTQINNWQTYAQKGDANSIQRLYTPDGAVALFTEGPTPPVTGSVLINGAAAIAADLNGHFHPPNNQPNPYANLTLQEVTYGVQGNWGYSYGNWNTGSGGPYGSWSVVWTNENNTWLIKVHSVVPYIPGS
jgi:ketosteroid isomerase-like protein